MQLTPSHCSFLPDGTVLSKDTLEDNVFYIGVGGIEHPRVFDHHRPGLPVGTTPAGLIWAQQDALGGACSRFEDIQLVCHYQPHWNSCWAAALLLELLAGESLDTPCVEAFNRYAALVLVGHNPVEGVLERSPLAVFEGLMAEIEEGTRNDPASRDRRKLLEGIEFFRYLKTREGDSCALQHVDLGDAPEPYARVLPRLRADQEVYRRDLHQGRRFIATVAHRRGITHRVDGLLLREPVSRFFKFWARSDREHSPGRAGFPLLWVQWSQTRWVVSVDPASGYSLEGLGDALTTAETRRQPPPPGCQPRPGYTVPDPWFDGRGTAYPFTIIDSPKQGTRLSERKIERQLRRFFRVRQWRPAFTRPSPVRDRWLPLTAPVAVSVAISGAVGHWLLSEPADGCSGWETSMKVTDGKHYVIAIGVDDYQAPHWPDLRNPVREVREVVDLLIQRYGFEPLGMGSQLLISGGAGEKLNSGNTTPPEPNEQAIKDAILSLATDSKRITEQDTLLIYFSGHGSMDKVFGYWVPADGHRSADYIDDAWLHKVFRQSPARHILVVSDSCFSGKLAGDQASTLHPSPQRSIADGAGRSWQNLRGSVVQLFTDSGGKMAAPPASENLQAQVRLPSREFLSSGYLEKVPDGGGDRSPFATCFIQSLEQNTEVWLSGHALFQSLQDCLQGLGEQAPKPMMMRPPGICDGQGEMILRHEWQRAGEGG